jgi:hypothetical protein
MLLLRPVEGALYVSATNFELLQLMRSPGQHRRGWPAMAGRRRAETPVVHAVAATNHTVVLDQYHPSAFVPLSAREL